MSQEVIRVEMEWPNEAEPYGFWLKRLDDTLFVPWDLWPEIRRVVDSLASKGQIQKHYVDIVRGALDDQRPS